MLPGIIVPCSFRENEWFYPFYPGRRKRKKKRKKRKRKHKDLNPPRSYPAFGVFVMLGFGATWAKAGSWADMMLRTEAKTSESTGLKVVTVLTSIQKFQFLSNSFSLFRCGQATLRRTPRMPRKWRRTWWPGYGEVVLQIAKGTCHGFVVVSVEDAEKRRAERSTAEKYAKHKARQPEVSVSSISPATFCGPGPQAAAWRSLQLGKWKWKNHTYPLHSIARWNLEPVRDLHDYSWLRPAFVRQSASSAVCEVNLGVTRVISMYFVLCGS